MIALALLGTLLGSYLLGSIDTGIIVSRKMYRDDVRTHGSGGAGMTNMLRTFGKRAAAITAVGDVLKGALAVLLGGWLFRQAGLDGLYGGYLASVFALLGHWHPLFFGFRGGKGVLVTGGAVLALRPVFIPALAVVFFSFFLPTRMVSLGSIMMAVVYPILTVLYGVFWAHLPLPQLIFSTVCALISGGLILYMHRTNIQRIRNGTEYRFDGSHKKQ